LTRASASPVPNANSPTSSDTVNPMPARTAAEADSGGEEREDGHGHTGGDRPKPVLEVLGQPLPARRPLGRAVPGPPGGVRGQYGDGQSQQHPGHGGVHP
jgi:hypothetical protein